MCKKGTERETWPDIQQSASSGLTRASSGKPVVGYAAARFPLMRNVRQQPEYRACLPSSVAPLRFGGTRRKPRRSIQVALRQNLMASFQQFDALCVLSDGRHGPERAALSVCFCRPPVPLREVTATIPCVRLHAFSACWSPRSAVVAEAPPRVEPVQGPAPAQRRLAKHSLFGAAPATQPATALACFSAEQPGKGYAAVLLAAARP